MSDGPHKSLPMRRHWKKFAERAQSPAFSHVELDEAFSFGLRKDYSKVPLSEICDIFVNGIKASQCREEISLQLNDARQICRGSAEGNILLDCAIEVNKNGMTGDTAFRHAFKNALETYALDVCRQIEEHHLRKKPGSVSYIRSRLSIARSQCGYETLVSELTSSSLSNTDFRLTKRTGLDEGPLL